MATFTSFLNLIKPAVSDFFDLVTHWNDNSDKIDAGVKANADKLQAPVADLAALKAISTTSMPDRTMILSESLGLYRFDLQSVAAGDDVLIVQPTTGSGRWIKIADVTTTGTQTLTNKTLNSPTMTGTTVVTGFINAQNGAFILPQATVPAQTTDGSIVWDSDGEELTVGTGSARKTMADLDTPQTIANKTLNSPKIMTAIRDTNGNEVIKTPATANAVNEVTVTNAAAGFYPRIQASGDDAVVGLDIKSKGAARIAHYVNDLVSFVIDSVASAVNYIKVTSNITGQSPKIEAAGSDTNIGINLVPKGTGKVQANGVDVVTLTGTQTLDFKTLNAPQIVSSLRDGNGNELIKVSATTNAVNEVTVTNAISGNGPTVSASGDDANIQLNLSGKGSGGVRALVNGAVAILFDTVVSSVNYLKIKANITGQNPTIEATGTDTNIGINLVPKGTGKVKVVSDLEISSVAPIIELTETDTGSKFFIVADGDTISIRRGTVGNTVFTINADDSVTDKNGNKFSTQRGWKGIALATGSWVSDTSISGYSYRLNVSDADLAVGDVVDFEVGYGANFANIPTAESAGLMNAVVTNTAGTLKFFAASIPATNLEVKYRINK